MGDCWVDGVLGNVSLNARIVILLVHVFWEEAALCATCVYVCVYVCVCVRERKCVCVKMHLATRVLSFCVSLSSEREPCCVYICVCACVYLCGLVLGGSCAVYMCVCVSVCVCVFAWPSFLRVSCAVYVCVYVCVCVCVCGLIF